MFIGFFRQGLVLARIYLGRAYMSPWNSLGILFGMACMVGIMLALLSFTDGLNHAFRMNGTDASAYILSSGSSSELRSFISQEMVSETLRNLEDLKDKVIAAPELLVPLPPLLGQTPDSIYLRGVPLEWKSVHPEITVISGREFGSGSREVIIGTAVSESYGIQVDDRFNFRGNEWVVVGKFSADGSYMEGQFIGDIEMLRKDSAKSGFNAVRLLIRDQSSRQEIRDMIDRISEKQLKFQDQESYGTQNGSRVKGLINPMIYSLSALIALSVTLGAMRILIGLVNSRVKEIGILSALGFETAAIVFSIVVEVLAITIVGAALGILIAKLFYDGSHHSWYANIYQRTISVELIAIVVTWALLVGLVGSLVPAIRAARLNVVRAIRES